MSTQEDLAPGGKRFQIVVSTYEEGDDEPVVTHLFFGHTKDEAQAVLAAHLKADRFLRQCLEENLYAGSVECSNDIYLEDNLTGEQSDVPGFETEEEEEEEAGEDDADG